MLSWRIAAVGLLAAVPSAWGQGGNLGEMVKPGDCFQYTLDMKLTGELRIKKETGPATVKLSAAAAHAYTERVLASADATASRAVRAYDAVKVAIDAGADRTERSLRPARRLIVAQRHKDERLVYCPAGALTRGEIDAVGDHFDTLAVAAVLPGKDVKPGEGWKVGSAAAQALCNLEGVTESKLEGKLVKVVVDQATFAVAGTVKGVENGAQVTCAVEATGVYDLKANRLVKLEWAQKDERDQGPVSPASTIQTRVVVTRKPVEMPAELNDVGTVGVPDGYAPPAAMTFVEHRDPKGRFALYHAREWQLTAVTADHAVFRCLDRGDFIAQATVTPWTKAQKGKHLEPEEFKKAMHNTSGWRPERELQAEAVPSADGKYIYRLSVTGQLDGVPVLQNFFLVANADGDQAVVTFTMSQKNVDKLGARDLSLAGGLELPAPAIK
ncbi:MAG: hypothetical protein ACRC33_27125 [Gemmataceae bacterium]